MGYTHYLKNKPAFTDAQWTALCADVKKLFDSTKHNKIELAGPDGSGKPIVSKTRIMFNGVGDDSHETAYVSKAASPFEFCKTAHKPYDCVVVEFYKLIRKHAPSTVLSSDGGDEVFGGQKIMINNKYTYLTGEFDVKVGDVVLLPSNFDGSDWQGTVTAIGSKYDGDCKIITGIVEKDPDTKPFVMDQIDPDDQITTEESVAAILVDKYWLPEEDAADASREIVSLVCKQLKFVCEKLSAK